MSSKRKKPQPDYDQPLKAIFEADPDGVLELLAQPVKWVKSRSPELPSRMRRADLVWEVERPGRQHGLLHIELQTQVEEHLDERVTEYSLRLWLRDKLPVRSMVIFFRPGGALPVSPFNWSWDAQGGYGYPFEMIRLWEFQPEQILETPHYMLWPLAGVMGKEVTPDSFGRVAEQIIHTPLLRPQVADLVGELTAIGGLRLQKEEIVEALRRHPMLEDLLRESSFTEVVADILRPEIKAEGRAEGLAEGRAEGLAEGRAEGMREAARKVLTKRFETIPEDLLTALHAADEATLNALLDYIVTDSLEQLRTRLRQP